MDKYDREFKLGNWIGEVSDGKITLQHTQSKGEIHAKINETEYLKSLLYILEEANRVMNDDGGNEKELDKITDKLTD